MPLHTVMILIALLAAGCSAARAQQAAPIEVFPFELEDRSAGAGIIPPDDFDRRYLAEAEQVTKDLLARSGRYKLVAAPAGEATAVPADGLRHCGGCEAGIAKKHGAAFALLGVVTRVNRTEHTLFIRILDAETARPVSTGFTDLRMGANHAWPRSAKWVMTNRILK